MKLLLLVAAMLVAFFDASAQDAPSYLLGRIVVQYEDGRSAALKSSTGDPAQQLLDLMGAGFGRPFLSAEQEQSALQRLGSRKVVSGSAYANLDDLRRTYVYEYSGDMDPAIFAAKLTNMPGVKWAEPWFVQELHSVPNDLYVGQIGHDYFYQQGFYDAWDITKSSEDIVIAIVDSGVDYTHPDLYTKMWINYDEIPSEYRSAIDANSDGRITSLELHNWIRARNIDHNGDGRVDLRDAAHSTSPLTNGADTDGNGYVDDIFGIDLWENTFGNTATRDNDPYGEFGLHGTHVAGLAAAHTNNGVGVAGAGYNAIYMAVKAGGAKNYETSIGFGGEGIFYAAVNGAHVINCSFGGSGYSSLNHLIVQLANALGSVVVASAGNAGTSAANYPASYPEVINVGSVDFDGAPIGTKSDFSNFGYTVDVLATGQRSKAVSPAGILSTYRNPASSPTGHTYAYAAGTSMAAPLVSGLAALLVSHRPDWSPERIAAQIRATSTMVDDINSEFLAGQIGHGVINAYKALTVPMPGFVVRGLKIVNESGTKAGLDEDAFVEYTVVNYGEPATVQATLQTSFPGFQILNNSVSVTASTDEEIAVRFPVRIVSLNQNVPLLRIDFENAAMGYSDFNYQYFDGIYLDEIQSSRFYTSLNSFANIGAIDPLAGVGVTGFVTDTHLSGENQENVIFEAGLMVLTKNRIADAVRGIGGVTNKGFIPMEPFVAEGPGSGGWDMYGRGKARLRAQSAVNPFNVDTSLTVKVEGYVFDRPETNKVLFLKYTLKNESDSAIADSTYIGLFADIDIGVSGQNSVGYLADDSLQYVYSPSQPDRPYVAVVALGNTSSALAINMAATGNQLDFGLNDGFTTEEKIRALKAGLAKPTTSNADVSTVVATGPYHIHPGQEVVAGFLVAYGNSLEDLRFQVAAARARQHIVTTQVGVVTSDVELQPDLPVETAIRGNYPNPFNPSTTIAYDLARAGQVSLTVHNVLGQKVATLIDGQQLAGHHQLAFDASRLGSGVYFVRMVTPDGVRSHKMTLVK